LLIIRFYEINIPFAGYFLHEVWGFQFDFPNFPTERSLLGVVAEGALRENALKKCSDGRRKEFPFLQTTGMAERSDA
jgi:hypothetical protein